MVSVNVIAGNGDTMDEYIVVEDCNAGWIRMEDAGGGVYCVFDETQNTSGDHDDFPDGEDGGGWDGGGVGMPEPPVRQEGWDDAIWDEIVRQWNCDWCTVAAGKCVDQAKLAETLCRGYMTMMAEERCNPEQRFEQTLTPFGCTLHMHESGVCPNVPAPWKDEDLWTYHCEEEGVGRNRRLFCAGQAMGTCSSAWAVGHPGLSTQVIDQRNYSAQYSGLTSSTTKTVTATYQLTPQGGFLQACMAVGNSLAMGCATEQHACLVANNCKISTP